MKMKTCFQHKGWIPEFTLLTVIFSFVAASTTSGQKVLIRAVGESLQFPTSVPVSGDIEFKGSTIGTVFNKQTDINLTEEFKNRLHWNSQSGLFTLSDLRMEDSGVYKLESTKKPRITQYHQLNVYDKVSAPRVTNTTTNSSSENKLCSLLCSVKNVKEMNLCWIKSSVILKQTYSSNYNDTVHLPLEIQQRDHDKYSCVASNPVSNQTAVIYIKELCQISAEVKEGPKKHIPTIIVFSIVFVLVIIGMAWCLWRKKMKNQSDHRREDSSATEGQQEEVQYSVISHRNRNQGNICEHTSEETCHLTTIYDKIQPHK
ncbi:SLAM family member 7-like isoform X2 [Hoplias malabaricus]|uniref:SLAM family member 7-like isoform X2 n=1 Tax=Hoplias malabaricus TaxID=27720 RepID=UPI0034629877